MRNSSAVLLTLVEHAKIEKAPYGSTFIDLDHKSVNKFRPLKSNSEDSTHNSLKLVTRGF